MHLIRSLIAVSWMLCSAAGLAQSLTLVSSTAAGGPIDVVAINLQKELRTILGKSVYHTYEFGEFGAVAVRKFRSARADGSQLLVLGASLGRAVPEVSGLVPIATIVGETPRYHWVGVFAPPGTPANLVQELETAIMAGLSVPDFGQKAGHLKPHSSVVGINPTPGNHAHLARLIAQSAGSGNQSTSLPSTRVGSNIQADDSKVTGGAYRP